MMQRSVDHEQLEDDLQEYPACYCKSRVQTLKVLSEQTKAFMFPSLTIANCNKITAKMYNV